MIHNTNDLEEFKRNLLPSLVDLVDNIMTEKDWKKVITHDKSVQKINYHLDRQGTELKNPTRWRYAIQVQAGATDPKLKDQTRSKGERGGHFNKSYPTFAQVELECNSCITADKLREAFYASMIPQENYLRLGWLHRVVVHKNGTYTVEANQKWKKAEGL